MTENNNGQFLGKQWEGKPLKYFQNPKRECSDLKSLADMLMQSFSLIPYTTLQQYIIHISIKRNRKQTTETIVIYDTHTRSLRYIRIEIQLPLCTNSIKNIFIFLESTKGKKQFSNNNEIYFNHLGSGKAYFFFSHL